MSGQNTELNRCTIPPTGWKCTRMPGHIGPCAAVPDADSPPAPAVQPADVVDEAAIQQWCDAMKLAYRMERDALAIHNARLTAELSAATAERDRLREQSKKDAEAIAILRSRWDHAGGQRDWMLEQCNAADSEAANLREQLREQQALLASASKYAQANQVWQDAEYPDDPGVRQRLVNAQADLFVAALAAALASQSPPAGGKE